MSIEIKLKKNECRAVSYDGIEEIGECCYKVSKKTWNIIHTEVDENYQGQGIAKKLVECVIENSQKENKKVKADCTYAKKILEKRKYMSEALKEAQKAYQKNEVPVGAIIVKDGNIIARAHNIKELKQDTTNHAEILAIQKASKKLKTWRLEDCTMYVTLEPCTMCAGAIIQARINKVVIGTMDEKTGACGSVLNLLEDYKFNHIVKIETKIMEKECRDILQKFFKELRTRNR